VRIILPSGGILALSISGESRAGTSHERFAKLEMVTIKSLVDNSNLTKEQLVLLGEAMDFIDRVLALLKTGHVQDIYLRFTWRGRG
jgi:hypothetical protein